MAPHAYSNFLLSLLLTLRQTDTANVSIIVLNVNDWDPRFRYPSFDFTASSSARSGDVVGRLTVYDGDRGDRVSLGLMGQDARWDRAGGTGRQVG